MGLRWVVVCLTPLLLLSCAAKRPAETVAPAQETPAPLAEQPPPVPSFDELYVRLADNGRLYEEGIELIVAGDEVLGETRITAATNSLLADASECAEHPACDVHRFLDTYDRLLAEQAMALKQQAVRVVELETHVEEDLEREPGTSPFVSRMPIMWRFIFGKSMTEWMRVPSRANTTPLIFWGANESTPGSIGDGAHRRI